MINSTDFTTRLKIILKFYEESASSFAEKIGVQRSSISHILSGRNKPSLDFVMKVLHSYPEVDLYWLMNGDGQFPKQHSETTQPNQPNLFSDSKTTTSTTEQAQPFIKDETPVLKTSAHSDSTSSKTIERIVIFFSDGSFKSYEG